MREISWRRFGYHVVYDTDVYDAINFAYRQGFGYVVPDMMVPRFFPERFSQSERRHLREIAASKNVSLAFHGPSDYLNLTTLYPEIRRATLERMKMCIDLAIDVQAERFTVHAEPPFDFVFAGREGTFLKDHWTTYKDALRNSLIELSEHAQGLPICVENHRLGRMVIEVLEELLATEGLFLTWDLPKSHNENGDPIVEVENFLRNHVDKVIECHLHDQRSGKPSHDNIGAGKIDFAHYLEILLPLDTHFTLEIRPREDALKSYEILKTILERIGWKVLTREE